MNEGCAWRLAGLLTTLLIAAAATAGDVSSRSIAVFLALAVSALLLFLGARALLRRWAIGNVRAFSIGTAAAGLVALHGQARRRQDLISPASNVACCWWYCEVSELLWTGSKWGRKDWVTIKRISSSEPFYLQDATGRVLVDPKGASVEGPSVEQVLSLDGPEASRLAQCLTTWDVVPTDDLGAARRIRIHEKAIPENQPLCVIGQLAPNDGDAESGLEKEGKLLRAPIDKTPFVISNQSQREVMHSLSWEAIWEIVIALSLAGGSVWTRLVPESDAILNFTVAAISGGLVLLAFWLIDGWRERVLR